jgi:hypothetical protein
MCNFRKLGAILDIIILPAVLYGCETWCLTLLEEHKLWGYLRTGCCGELLHPKTNEITGDWRKLHYEEIHTLHSSPNIIRMIKSRTIKYIWHVAGMGRRRMHKGFC